MWFKWALVGACVLDLVIKILIIGKPRQAVTKGDAAGNAVGDLLLIAGLLYFWR